MRNLIKLIGPIIAIVILFILSAKFGFGRISELQSDIKKERRDETALSQKLSVLNSVEEEASQATQTSAALPDKNPSLATISQIKNLSAGLGLLISGIKGGSEVADGADISHVDVSFDVDGSKDSIFQFLGNVSSVAPISTVEKVKLVDIGGGASRASVTIRSYFAAFPEKLPALTEAVKELTADEKKTLTEVLGLTQPSFVEVPPSTGGKADPFGL